MDELTLEGSKSAKLVENLGVESVNLVYLLC